MNLTKLEFCDTSRQNWDTKVSQLANSTYAHSSFWIAYMEKFPFVERNSSFLLLDDNQNPVAACPIGITTYPKGKSLSFSGAPLAVPVVNPNISESLRRKAYARLKEELDEICKAQGIMEMSFFQAPIHNHEIGPLSNSRDMFRLIEWNLRYYVQNSLVLDLTPGEEKLLEEMNKFHRKHIRKTQEKGVRVSVVEKNMDTKVVQDFFDRFMKAHIASAGKLTRPVETWAAMCESVISGHATLFVSLLDEKPISFLLCGQWGKSAIGWSQVNIEEFEREYSPRHHLEWTAISHYSRLDFSTYELGERFSERQLFHSPTEKEISIADFKERFGGVLLPKIYWNKYTNEQDEKNHILSALNSFIP